MVVRIARIPCSDEKVKLSLVNRRLCVDRYDCREAVSIAFVKVFGYSFKQHPRPRASPKDAVHLARNDVKGNRTALAAHRVLVREPTTSSTGACADRGDVAGATLVDGIVQTKLVRGTLKD